MKGIIRDLSTICIRLKSGGKAAGKHQEFRWHRKSVDWQKRNDVASCTCAHSVPTSCDFWLHCLHVNQDDTSLPPGIMAGTVSVTLPKWQIQSGKSNGTQELEKKKKKIFLARVLPVNVWQSKSVLNQSNYSPRGVLSGFCTISG